jgi:glycosyltransferase involved in cell wall biosynthesis
MLNILHSIDTPGPGGAETVYLDIVTGLDRARFTSFPVIPAKGWIHDQLQEQGLDPIIIDPKGSFNIRYLWQLVKVIRKQNIDLIHSHLFGSNVYCSLAGLLTSTPVISTFHGFVDAGGSGQAMKSKVAVINKGSKKIVFVSHQLKKHFIENYGIAQARAEVIYNGIDPSKFKPGKNNALKDKLGLAGDDTVVGSIGNIRPAKGYDILLRAAAEVKRRRRDVKFVIAGQGSGELYRELLALREKLNLQDTVFFLGFTKNTVDFLHGINLFLLSSTSEGFSLSLIEAMACGLPVISTKCGGPEEIVGHGVSGILVPPGDPHMLVNALLNRDERLETIMVENAVALVAKRFSLTAVMGQYERLMEEVCKS